MADMEREYFFPNSPYYMGNNQHLYSADINHNDTIDATSLFYHDDWEKISPS